MSFCSWIPMGRAGNFMFQAASCFGHCKKHGLTFSVPKQTTHPFWSPIYLEHLQHPDFNPNVQRVMVREEQFHYKEIPFDEAWRGQNIILQGYYQSWKYFDEYREELLNSFAIPWKLIEDTCSIHARFGDYLSIEGKHILVNEPYLREAMQIVTAKTGITKFKVFSDDIQHFKNNFGHISQFEYSSNADIMQDLVDASCCHSQIGSSSSYSWWINYLNRNPSKVIVTQSEWFKKNWDGANTDDVLMPDWIKL